MNISLPFEETDDRMRRAGVELGAVGSFEATGVAGEFNRRDLHSQADAEIRDVVFAGVARGGDFAFFI